MDPTDDCDQFLLSGRTLRFCRHENGPHCIRERSNFVRQQSLLGLCRWGPRNTARTETLPTDPVQQPAADRTQRPRPRCSPARRKKGRPKLPARGSPTEGLRTRGMSMEQAPISRQRLRRQSDKAPCRRQPLPAEGRQLARGLDPHRRRRTAAVAGARRWPDLGWCPSA